MKQKFRLEKDRGGAITFESYINELAVGFSTPDGDGEKLAKFLKNLKEGEDIIIMEA